DWPVGGVLKLDGLGNEILGARLLAEPSRKVVVAGEDGRVALTVGQNRPDAIASVVAVDITGDPIVFTAPKIEVRSTRFVDKAVVKITCKSNELQGHYTVDGSEPTLQSPSFGGPKIIAKSCTVKARSFFEGRPVSATTTLVLEKVAPRRALTLVPKEPGLVRERFTGDFQRMPDFSKLQPTDSDTVDEIHLQSGAREEHVAYVFRGDLRVPADDVYSFALLSDDGSRLWVDGNLVVDNDGLHGPVERTGNDALAAGWHAIRVEWFNLTGGAELALEIQASAGPARPIAAADFAH
ncbi:MAG TPA: PA14 domain-containing protein, partial [Planctomycetota bacterium]|nr:PA14 domain-containing protein [Planctomycetota bacterium]